MSRLLFNISIFLLTVGVPICYVITTIYLINIFGYFKGLLTLVVLPITYIVTPFYAVFANGHMFLIVLNFGIIILGYCLFAVSQMTDEQF